MEILAKEKTLRDEFAMHAPDAPDWWVGLKVRSDHQRMLNDKTCMYQEKSTTHWKVQWCWEWANSMLEERGD